MLQTTEKDIILTILKRLQLETVINKKEQIEFVMPTISEDITIDFDEQGKVIDIY